jgi:hypothetical protein
MTFLHSQVRGLDALDAPDANGPRLLFAEHHDEIEGASRALLAATYTDDSRELITEYRSFEREILEHLEAEEDVILPAYEHHVPVDARALRSDHARIRERLTRIGIDCDLHAIRAGTLEDLISELRAHAAREDAQMYPWARVHLPLDTKRDLFARLAASIDRLARIAGRSGGAVPSASDPSSPLE